MKYIIGNIFISEIYFILIEILLQSPNKTAVDNRWALFQVMDWRQTDDKPLHAQMIIRFNDAYTCTIRP